MAEISTILGVTTSELLNGEKSSADTEKVQEHVEQILQYAEKEVKIKAKSFQKIGAVAFSLFLLFGIAVCAVCDVAISGSLTWSLFPISSIIFVWLVFIPMISIGKKGVCITLVAFSVFIFPFLYVMNHLVKTSDLLLPIGMKMAAVTVVFLWIVFAFFKIWKTRKRIASALSLLLVIPVCVVINFSLSQIIFEPIVDVWDILVFILVLISAIVLIAKDISERKTEHE